MKLFYLAIMMVFASTLIAASQAFADDTGDMKILRVGTQPSDVHVGDSFAVTATLVNTLPSPVYLDVRPCGEPFHLDFDNYVKVEYPLNVVCPDILVKEKVNSGQEVTETNPRTSIPSGTTRATVIYRAVTPGTVNTTATFSYYLRNGTDLGIASVHKTISKSFQFKILGNNTVRIPENTTASFAKIHVTYDANTLDIAGNAYKIFSQNIVLTVFDPQRHLITVSQLVPSQDGTFSESINTSSPLWSKQGNYTVKVASGSVILADDTFYFPGTVCCKSNHPALKIPAEITSTVPLAPLRQFKLGIDAQDVKCQPPLVLVTKSENDFPACIKPNMISRLTKQGWNLSQDNGTGPIQTRFQSRLISKESAIKIALDYVTEQNRTRAFNYSNSTVEANLVYYISMQHPRVPVDYQTGLPTSIMNWLDEYIKILIGGQSLKKTILGCQTIESKAVM